MATIVQKDFKASRQNPNLVKPMQQYPFIFSDERKWKVRRHFYFWLWWWTFQSLLYSFVAYNLNISYVARLPISALEAFFYLIPHMFLSYSLMYWVIPRFLLKGRYVGTAFMVGLLFIATALISSLIGVYILRDIRYFIFGNVSGLAHQRNYLYIFPALLAGLRGAITVGGLAASIKMMKYWYVKEQRNLKLQKENVESQLELLKAQVHPHFLFNTLNNIYSFTQTTSPAASRLVMGLSEMLRYMLYECNQPLVPLAKELKMMKDYITLEEIRYNEQLDINLNLPKNTDDLYIAPLLLLPFIENCFKHGTSQMLENPWITMHISLNDSQLEMKLINGKAGGYIKKEGSGIGIENVRKRLELLYPGKYSLRINHEEDVFVVTLKVKLEKITSNKQLSNFKTAVA